MAKTQDVQLDVPAQRYGVIGVALSGEGC
jgi:hypothetical protein